MMVGSRAGRGPVVARVSMEARSGMGGAPPPPLPTPEAPMERPCSGLHCRRQRATLLATPTTRGGRQRVDPAVGQRMGTSGSRIRRLGA